MSTEIAKRQTEHELAALTKDQVELVKRTIAKDATDDELALFLNVCNRTGLDPFARQIFLIPRYDSDLGRNVKVPQVSIDGARLVADRTGAYRPGSVYFYDAEGKESTVWIRAEPPFAARATVFKDGHEVPGIPIRYDERVQRNKDGAPRAEWKRQPAHMLAKCAEMATLRQAFPHDLSGVYVEGEGEEKPILVETIIAEELASEEQLDALAVLLDQFADKRDALDDRLRELYPEVGAEADTNKLTRRHADELLERLNQQNEEATA